MDCSLSEYVQTRSAQAFRRLVDAHVDAVYSQCLRELRDPSAAEEITQLVFIDLARKAGTIRTRTTPGGWLFIATRYSCAIYRRAAARRRWAERKAATMRKEMISSPDPDADPQIQPEALLDDALGSLNQRDRNAVLMRFFEKRSMREVGEAQGVSEDTAKHRVLRAVDKMRDYFSRKGVIVPSAAVMATLASAVRPAGSHIAPAAAQAGIANSVAMKVGLLSQVVANWAKIAAAVAAVGAITGAVWMNGRTTSVQSVVPRRPQIELVAAAVDSAPASAPAATTQPMPQDTPANALIKFCTAMEEDDRQALDDCVYTAQTPQRPIMTAVALEEIAAVFRLQQLWKSKFGGPISAPGYDFVDLPAQTFSILRGLAKINSGKFTVDGDLATFTWPMGPDIFGGSGPDRDPAAARWKDAQLVLRHVDGNWKLDMDHTFDLIFNITRKPGNNGDTMQLGATIQSAIARGFDDLANQIQDGTITTADEASAAAKGVCDAAFNQADVAGENETLLPVVGGEQLVPRSTGMLGGILSTLVGGATTSPAAAPATRPQGQDNPVDTLSKLCTALEQNDQAAMDECLCDDGVDPGYAALGRNWLHGEAAVFRIEKDWSEKFGQGMNVSGLNFDMFPKGPFEIVLRGVMEDPNGVNVKIDGDEAHVRVPLPPDTFVAAAPMRFAAFERWSGGMFVFTQSDGVWRLNTDRTFNFIVSVNRLKGNNDDAIDIEAKLAAAIAQTLNDAAGQIENGSMATEKQARTAILAQVVAAFKSAKVNGTNIAVLPVVGGTP